MKSIYKAMIPMLTICAGLLAATAQAEFRAWSDVNGNTVEAEYIRMAVDTVVLRKRDGKEVRVPLNTLSEGDRQYAMLLNPPRIDIVVKDDVDSSMLRARRNSEARMEAVNVDVQIRKASSEAYDAELSLDVILIGKTLPLSRYEVLEHSRSKFAFSNENKGLHECRCGPVDIRNIKGGRNQGSEYEGYLVVVRDSRNQVIAVKGSRLEFEKNAGALLDADKGDAFDEDFHAIDSQKPKRRRL